MVENGLYLGVLLLWLIHGLGLYRALRRTSPTPALVGAALSMLGLVLLAAGAIPHVATAPLSDLYQAPGATPQDQATLVLLWLGIEAVFEALLYTGLVILPLGLIALGTAMFGASGYGPRLGGATLAFGVAGLAAAAAVLAGATDMAALGVLALIGFHLLLGPQDPQDGQGAALQEGAAVQDARGRMTATRISLAAALALLGCLLCSGAAGAPARPRKCAARVSPRIDAWAETAEWQSSMTNPTACSLYSSVNLRRVDPIALPPPSRPSDNPPLCQPERERSRQRRISRKHERETMPSARRTPASGPMCPPPGSAIVDLPILTTTTEPMMRTRQPHHHTGEPAHTGASQARRSVDKLHVPVRLRGHYRLLQARRHR